MGKDHLKRLAAPKAWDLKRKGQKFITKSSPGPHSSRTGMPLGVLLKDTLKYAKTAREAKKILNAGNIKIDGKARKDLRFSIGIFDAIEFTETNEYYRVVLNNRGKMDLIKISKEESSSKPCKIIGKSVIDTKLQLNLYDGKNVLVSGWEYKVGDTLILSLPEQKIKSHITLGKKSMVFLTGGKHVGETGNVEDIVQDRIIYKDEKGNLIETSKKHVFVVGDGKTSITVK